MYHYDDSHYIKVADQMIRAGKCSNLIDRIGYEELVNHISTVFFTEFNEIHVGKADPALQRHIGKGLVGMTLKSPIQNRQATDEENEQYLAQFRQKLEENNIAYIPCKGRARNYPLGGNGCFILCDVTPAEVMELLLVDGEPSQLSIVYLPPTGEAQLVSCIESLVLSYC